VRLVTWNIQHGRHAVTGRPDADALAAAAAGLGADVLALQEVDRRTGRVGGADLLAVVADATGLTPVDGAVVAFDGGTYGNALLVRPDLFGGSGGTVRLHRPWWPPWRRPEPRGAVVARLAEPSLLVVGCHLGLRRSERRRQLPGALRAADAEVAAVLLGDLNSFRGEIEPHARRHGFAVVEVPPAFPAHAPRAAIDHVLTRGVAARPLPGAERPVVSDHRPVSVELLAT